MKYAITALAAAALMSSPAACREITDVLASIESNNIGLRSIAAGNDAERHDLRSQNLPDGPSVEYSPFFRDDASGVASSELVVSQEFDFPTLYVARHRSGRARSAALDASYAVERRNLLLDAYGQCLDYIRLNESIDLMERRMAVSDSLMSMCRRRLDSGDATILDINRIELERMELKASMIQLHADRDAIVSALTALNGDIVPELGDLQYPAALDPMAGYATDAEVRAADLEVDAAQREVSAARQEWLPSLTVGYRRNTELNEAANGFMVGASFPLYSTSSKVKSAKARALQSTLNRDNIALRVRTETESQRSLAMSQRQALDAYDLDLMNGTLALMRKSVSLGNMSVTDYYVEADGIYTRLQSRIDLLNSYYRTLIQLNKNAL